MTTTPRFNIVDALEATNPPPNHPTRRQQHTPGFEYNWDGNAGFLQTGPMAEQPKTWDAFIRDAGLDPTEVEVIEPVQVRGWDAIQSEKHGPNKTASVVRMHYYRLNLRRRTLLVNLDELVKAAKTRRKPPPNKRNDANHGSAFLVALGDLQLGKVDGDGVEGTVNRFMASTAAAADRYRLLHRKTPGMPIYLCHLGDCIEGYVSQGGANGWRTTLTTTEQVRLYRRLLIEQIKAFSALTPRLVVAGIPGNHDEAHRPLHSYGDSWAIDSIAAVKDALELAGGYPHVTLHAPARDELTVTLDMCGTIVGLAHGHQWRPGQACAWWARQAHGRQPVGDADLLLSAHLHHLRVEDTGPKTWIQVPALESESTWWRHRTGEVSRPGVVTAVVGGGSYRSLEVL